MEKKLDDNYTRMLQAILKKSLRHHPTKQQLYGHLPLFMKTIQVRWTRHVGHSLRSRDELIRDILLWTPLHGQAKAGRPARTYIQQLCADTRCSPEDLWEGMDDREGWQERVRDICADGVTWWWWLSFYTVFLFLDWLPLLGYELSLPCYLTQALYAMQIQLHPWFELGFLCPYSMAVTFTIYVLLPKLYIYIYIYIEIESA